MDLGLKGKVALVTGAGSQIGFGKGIVLTLAKEGCDIIAVDIDLEGAEQTAADARKLGSQALALKADVTHRTEVGDMVKTALQQFHKIDILVNNAGGATPPSPFVEKPETDWEKDINLNLNGVMYCTKAVLPQMISRKSGKIINISSVGGIDGVPTGSAYGAAKAGVINFTQGLAREVVESGINVNCIAPGLGNTRFYDNFPSEMVEFGQKMEAEGKATTPQDIGNVVAFLASDVSIRILGQCLRVSGVL
jgi:NAD(P)-dependent dehydrogenase (short-subunit alcohol dehydrogenase family)